MTLLLQTELPIWQLVARAAVVYIAVLIMLRLCGKREMAQLGMPEFIGILLISDAVQNSMMGSDTSLAGGLIVAATILAMSRSLQFAMFRSTRAEHLIQGRPALLVHSGEIAYDNLRKEMLTIRELKALLAKQGVTDIEQVAEATLESDGYVSVILKHELKRHEEWKKQDVY